MSILPGSQQSMDLVTQGQASPKEVSPSEEIDERQGTEDIVGLSNTSDEKERKTFMQDINKFMSEIGKPLSKIPIMGYKELDLFQLFKEVVAYGGFNEVVKNVGTWSKIWKRLGNFDPSITDSSFRLKKNYERYLLEYEYKIYPGHRLNATDAEKQTQVKKTEPVIDKRTERTTIKGKKLKKTRSLPLVVASSEIVRDKNGLPKMPLILGDLTIENLGTIVSRSPFISDKNAWPTGFQSSRLFTSMIQPLRAVKYTCKIVEAGDRPQFVVTAEDDPDNPVTGATPSAAWKIVMKKIAEKTNAKSVAPASGAVRFGLSHPLVASLIRELPNGDKFGDIPSDDSDDSSPSSSPASSPSMTRKRKPIEEESSESSEDMDNPLKSSRVVTPRDYEEVFSARSVLFATREEIDDLESAVATLYALKYCAVY